MDFGFETEGNSVVDYFADRVKGRHFLITGPTPGGIGAETAISLARASPATLILIGRSRARCQPTLDAIASINSAVKVKFLEADLASPRSVRAAARAILSDPEIPRLDAVINNAGVMFCPFQRTPVEEYVDEEGGSKVEVGGFETQLAASHVGHFLLTNLLMPKIRSSAGLPSGDEKDEARVVTVSSVGNVLAGVRWADPNYRAPGAEAAYDPIDAYGQAKTANVLFAVALDKRLRLPAASGTGTDTPGSRSRPARAFAVHPGSIATGLQKYMTDAVRDEAVARVFGATAVKGMSGAYKYDSTSAPAPAPAEPEPEPESESGGPDAALRRAAASRKTLQQGCATQLRAALDPALPDVAAGRVFLSDCAPVAPGPEAPFLAARAVDEADAERLWGMTEEMVGQKFEY